MATEPPHLNTAGVVDAFPTGRTGAPSPSDGRQPVGHLLAGRVVLINKHAHQGKRQHGEPCPTAGSRQDPKPFPLPFVVCSRKTLAVAMPLGALYGQAQINVTKRQALPTPFIETGSPLWILCLVLFPVHSAAKPAIVPRVPLPRAIHLSRKKTGIFSIKMSVQCSSSAACLSVWRDWSTSVPAPARVQALGGWAVLNSKTANTDRLHVPDKYCSLSLSRSEHVIQGAKD